MNHVLAVGAFKFSGDDLVVVADPIPTNELQDIPGTASMTAPPHEVDGSQKEKEIHHLRSKVEELEKRLQEETMKRRALESESECGRNDLPEHQQEIQRLEAELADSQKKTDFLQNAMEQFEQGLKDCMERASDFCRKRGRKCRHVEEIRRLEAALKDLQDTNDQLKKKRTIDRNF